MNIPTEHAEQAQLINWLDWIAIRKWPSLAIVDGRLPYFAVPNGGARSAITGARLRSEGVRRGVPDLFLAVPRGESHGLFIELKRLKGGKVSLGQRQWHAALSMLGYRVVICRGHLAAIDAIIEYLEGEG